MLRLGLIDFDSSHAVEFTRRINGVGISPEQTVQGARVELGFPGESVMSPERIVRHTPQVVECGVRLVDDPREMLGQVDGVLICSVQGEAHYDHALPFLAAGIPTYVDKPMAASVAKAEELYATARRHDAVLFSSSSIRFSDDVTRRESLEKTHGKLLGCVAHGPGHHAAGNPGLYHYGIHVVEMLLTLMGDDWREVSATSSTAADVLTVRFADERIGTCRAARSGSTAYGWLGFFEDAVISVPVSARTAYRNLCRAIVQSFEDGRPAVPEKTTLSVLRLIETVHSQLADSDDDPPSVVET